MRSPGEILVWLTSLGLVTGLAMILALLALIVYQGISAFWPGPIALIQFLPNQSIPGTSTGALAGEIMRAQPKRGAFLPNGSQETEYQIRTANRDTFGSSFRWISQSQIEKITFPSGILEIERQEFGNAIGFPLHLSVNGTTLPSSDPAFAPTLAQLTTQAAHRRRQIHSLERRQIGAINSQMTSLRNQLRYLRRQNSLTPEIEASINSKLAQLQAQFEQLAAQARQLRAAQTRDSLTLQLPSGQERSIPIGNIYHYFYPNDLSFFGKLSQLAYRFTNFLTQEPREANTEGGIFPAIFGTAVMTILMSIAVMPFGVIAAIYLREYARQGLLVRAVRIAVNNLAGVPSIVFGVFGLGFFVYLTGGTIDSLLFRENLPSPTFGTGGVLWASLTLALLTVPVVIVATEEALAAVPRGVREGSLACGASKWQTIQYVVLPAAAPGILTGLILAMARGAGEVAPLMLTGVVKLAPSLPIDSEPPFLHLERKFMHLGFHIYDLGFQSPDSEAAKPMVFATTLLLILLVVVLNLAAILIREHLRKKYASSAF